MSIPLERLYHYIECIAYEQWQEPVLIYRFYPYGSKEIDDLRSTENLEHQTGGADFIKRPSIYCNDQEPLDYNRYEIESQSSPEAVALCESVGYKKMNIRDYPVNLWDKAVLVHSEKRSFNLDLYQQDQFITVYYWSHAVIARDWFRYAQHVTLNKQVKKTFLIYNRAWGGTREYRLKFADLLIDSKLHNMCQMTCSPVEPQTGQHYGCHTFINSAWHPQHVLENYFAVSTAHSHYSADFDIEDYNGTDIEIVLETLFDDDRLHLTEKSLRPIACGQPFILAATQGSLEYLRSYGFKTYDHIWDESYDIILDAQERLVQITNLMQHIATWDADTRTHKMAQAQQIADYNRRHFFSKEFYQLVTDELKQNLSHALVELKQTNTSMRWIRWYELTIISTQGTNFRDKLNGCVEQLTNNEWNEIFKIVESYSKTTLTFDKINQ